MSHECIALTTQQQFQRLPLKGKVPFLFIKLSSMYIELSDDFERSRLAL